MVLNTNRLTITENEIKETQFSFNTLEGASLDRFPILIPAKLNEDDVQFQYDSGSSMFSLIIDNQRHLNLENAGSIDTLCCVSSWGKSYDFYRRRLNTSMRIGQLVEEKPYIYSSNAMDQYDIFPNWLMMGLTGNQIFLDHIILIDTKDNVFGINK